MFECLVNLETPRSCILVDRKLENLVSRGEVIFERFSFPGVNIPSSEVSMECFRLGSSGQVGPSPLTESIDRDWFGLWMVVLRLVDELPDFGLQIYPCVTCLVGSINSRQCCVSGGAFLNCGSSVERLLWPFCHFVGFQSWRRAVWRWWFWLINKIQFWQMSLSDWWCPSQNTPRHCAYNWFSKLIFDLSEACTML